MTTEDFRDENRRRLNQHYRPLRPPRLDPLPPIELEEVRPGVMRITNQPDEPTAEGLRDEWQQLTRHLFGQNNNPKDK